MTACVEKVVRDGGEDIKASLPTYKHVSVALAQQRRV
jgi:hypothetical protein